MSGQSTDDLTNLFATVEAEAEGWDFFALTRAIEQCASDLPRVGTSLDPRREAVDLAHEPSANFPRTTVTAFVRANRRPIVRSAFMGLTGPMGPLPFGLTEIAIFERNSRGPSPFADFLDLLSVRMLQSFYRAWANSQPCAQADRPADDHFATFLGAVSGAADLHFVNGGEREPGDGDHFDDWRRLSYGGHIAGLRSATAVADMLSHLLQRQIEITECVGRWRAVPDEARSRIGIRRGAFNTLGEGATLGGRYYSIEWDVAFRVPVSSMVELEDLLPGGHLSRLLSQAAHVALPAHLDWQARVEIPEDAIAPARLGSARLGLTGWVAPQKRQSIRSDLRISGRSIRNAA